MDLLYDEGYDASEAQGFLTKNCDEDSMDIYSGLGETPTHVPETPSMLFSPRVKQSMDLYEEILTEEIKTKDSSYEELKARFLAAQSQIDELRKRLEQTETQNTGLSSENLRLKKNISALLRTARQEVFRKDQEIKRLNQRSQAHEYNHRCNSQRRTFPNNPTNKPPAPQLVPQPGTSSASSPIAPASTPAPRPPPTQHRPDRTSSTSSTTSTPPASQTRPLMPPSHALLQPQGRRTPSTHMPAVPAATSTHPPASCRRRLRRSSKTTCSTPAPPQGTTLSSLPQPQQSKTLSSLSTTCKPSPPPTNPPPSKHRESRVSSTSFISSGSLATPTESVLPSPSQPGLSQKSTSRSSMSIPTNPPPPSSLHLPQKIRTSSISTSKESSPLPLPPPSKVDSPPPPPPTVDPPPPPPPKVDPPPPPPPQLDSPPPPTLTVAPPPPPLPKVDCPSPPVIQPPWTPQNESLCPDSSPPPPEKARAGTTQRPDTTLLEMSRSKRPTSTIPKCSSRLDLEAVDKQAVESQTLVQSSSKLPPELGELDTPKPLKPEEPEPISHKRSQPTDKRPKSSSEPSKDCERNHRNGSHRAEKESWTKYLNHRLLKRNRSQDAEEHHSSERAKSLNSRTLDMQQGKVKPADSESTQNGAEPEESRPRDSVREHRRDRHADRTGERKPSSSGTDRRGTTRNPNADGHVDLCKRKGDRTEPSSEDLRKAGRRREDENGRRNKRSEKHGDSDRRRPPKAEGRRKAEARDGEGSSKCLEKQSEEERNVPAKKQGPRENSPNRKLCFMETLNLTLSPVKKPQKDGVQPGIMGIAGGEEEDGEIVSGDADDEDQPNLEEFLILDELESSVNDTEIDQEMGRHAKPSSGILASNYGKLSPEEVEKDCCLTTTVVKQHTTKSVVVVHETQKVPSVPHTTECDIPGAQTSGPTETSPGVDKGNIVISKLPAEKHTNSPNYNPVQIEHLEPLDPHEDEMGSISEELKCSPSQNNTNPDDFLGVKESAEPIVLQTGRELQEGPSPAPAEKKKISSPVAAENKEKVSCLSPLTSPVIGEVKETVSFSCPMTSTITDEVKETEYRPVSSPVSEKVVSCPGLIPCPVSEEVNKSLSCLSTIKSPVTDEVKATEYRPVTSPVSEKVHKMESRPCPTTSVVAEVKEKDRPECLRSTPESHLQTLATASTLEAAHGGAVERRESSPKGSDMVSSTITLEALPQGDISLPDAIYALTCADESGDGVSLYDPVSSVSCVGVSKVSSTTEDMTSPGKRERVQERTPVKGYGPCDRRLHCRGAENDEAGAEPSSSVPLFYDEDSMMLTLRNLHSIPDIISPLRSPMPPAKRAAPHRTSIKPPHVKSLQRDFCSTAVVNSMKLKPNKESKGKDHHMSQDPQPLTGTSPTQLPGLDGLSPSSSDLEEGEILSDSNDCTAKTSPPKKSKLTRPADNNKNNKPSPKATSQIAKRSPEERRLSSKSARGPLSPPMVSLTSGRSRYKTVCPVGEQTPFTTMEEVIDTLKKVRFEIRKKYMKLHKVFPKKSFYAMMDHFQQSFMDYVENATFKEISTQVGELKARLRRLVLSVFRKVMNNGIVNRIFDLQATNLKQRLWEFVDVQLDYLFSDIQLALKTFCKPSVTQNATNTEQKESPKNRKVLKKTHVNTSPKKGYSPKEKRPFQNLQRRIKPCPVVPSRTGLGRGKDIRITCMERQNSDPEPNPPGDGFPPRSFPLTPERSHRTSMLISHNGTVQDRSDFEILTEQQASSLTFNLVRDTQMGEIFKCLMQGSDLLDASVVAGDATSWSLCTPRKEGLPGDSLLGIPSPSKFLSPSKFSSPMKFVTPTKFVTSPSKLIAAWSSLSPGKLCSPTPKLLHMPLHPAMFDESCLLELPSGSGAQRSYSLLAEDLAVSLTIPSPLKSDSHLSFLQPRTLDMMSTPESVISAHFGEDALLDGDDAWDQQDLHLALDTDNSSSSCCSSSTDSATTMAATGDPSSVQFQFKPNLPMQAVVMERSNDHFIVKIRQSATESVADVTLTADDSLSRTLTEEDRCHGETGQHTVEPVPKALFLEKSFGKEPGPQEPSPPRAEEAPLAPERPLLRTKASVKQMPLRPLDSASSADELEISTASEGRLAIVEDASSGSTPGRGAMDVVRRKRKVHQQKTQAKRARKEDVRGRGKRKKVASLSPRGPMQEKVQGTGSPPKTPPSSLSAKNVVKKKGAVVVAWTREEDRAILLDLKTKGASRDTFSALSEKLNKSSAQIAERFSQLMKLFKKQEKMDISSP